jgi:hypothetical protein
MPHQADLTDSCKIRPATSGGRRGRAGRGLPRPERGAGSAGRGAARSRLVTSMDQFGNCPSPACCPDTASGAGSGGFFRQRAGSGGGGKYRGSALS